MPDSKSSRASFKDLPLHESSRLSANKDKNGRPETSLNTTGKKLSAAGALLKDKHPELFFVAPRPGGFVKNITSPHMDPSRTDLKKADNKNRKPTLTAGNELRPVSIGELLETQISCPNFHRMTKDEERNNVVRMCSIAISTAIMLAQHKYDDITIEHVKHTEAYFRALKQEDGYPQNIGQLMQVIVNLKKQGKIANPPPDEEDSDDEDEENEDVQIADIIN